MPTSTQVATLRDLGRWTLDHFTFGADNALVGSLFRRKAWHTMSIRSFGSALMFTLAVGIAPRLAAQNSTPEFVYSFAPCPQVVTLFPGSSLDLVLDCVITTNNHEFPPHAEGAQGWSFSFAVGGLTVLDITTKGTIAASVDDDPPGLRQPISFELSELTSGGSGDCAGQEGALTAVVLFLQVGDDVSLPPEGPSVVARTTIRLQAPALAGESKAAGLFIVDGCQGGGSPVHNLVTWRAVSVLPEFGRCEFLVVADDRVFRRGDTDGNGEINLTDGVNVLRCKFLSQNCPTCRDAGDANDDGDMNLTDAIRIFGFLFRGTAPPESPGPRDCGVDMTEDSLPACEYEC